MKTLNEILQTVIKHDVALRGFDAESLPEAAKARVQNTLVSLESVLSRDELATLEKWTGGRQIFNSPIASDGSGCGYYVLSDGSLYFSSTGDSEVWSFASDFADERILNGYEGKLDVMDAELLQHLGGYWADAVLERGVRI